MHLLGRHDLSHTHLTLFEKHRMDRNKMYQVHTTASKIFILFIYLMVNFLFEHVYAFKYCMIRMIVYPLSTKLVVFALEVSHL